MSVNGAVMAFDMEVICRVCLGEKTELTDIFDPRWDIPNLLMTCSSVKVFENDGLPSHICKLCTKHANEASSFKRQCEMSDASLRNYISSVSNELYPEVKKEINSLTMDDDNKSINCTICHKRHSSLNDLIDHVLQNHRKKDESVFSCGICKRMYSNEFDLKKHQVTHKEYTIDGKINVCPLCKQDFPRHDLLMKHIGYHLEKSFYECLECKCFFTANLHLKRHIKKRHANELSDENSMNSDPIEFDDIEVKVEPEQDYEVPMIKCEQSLTESINNVLSLQTSELNNDSNLKSEYVDSNKDSDYDDGNFSDVMSDNHNRKIRICLKPKKNSKKYKIKLKKIEKLTDAKNSIENKHELTDNKKRQSGERSYLCSMCGKGFVTQSAMDKHMKTHVKENTKKATYECPVCGKVVNYSNHLRVHMRTHKDRNGQSLAPQITTNKKDLTLCSMCGKSCTSRSNLAVHMRRHLGVMTCVCKICGKGYPRSTDLTLHMRQHTGEKPFVCTTCGKGFARSDKLAIHVRIHTGEKPYSCQICGRAFAQSNDLSAHKRRNNCNVNQSNNSRNISTNSNLIVNDSHLLESMLLQNRAIELISLENSTNSKIVSKNIEANKKKNPNHKDEEDQLMSVHNRAIEFATMTNNLFASANNTNNRVINLINPESISRNISDLVKQNFIGPDITQRALDLVSANHANMLAAHQRNEYSDYTTATLLQNLSNVQSAQFDMR